MDWIERAIKESKDRRDEMERLAQDTAPLWESLVEALKNSVASYKALVPQASSCVESTKNHHLYTLAVIAGNSGPIRRNLVITLDSGERIITAKYDGAGTRSASVEIQGGSPAYLMIDGIPKLTQEAAEYFLKPFLFPELDSV